VRAVLSEDQDYETAMRVSFGDFTFDSDSRELRRGAEPVRLSPKALQLLEILVLTRPKAISKSELQNRLWPDTFVVEKNLANLISEIREALGDDRSDPRFIRTVPRYGYAFRELGTEIIESRTRLSRLTWTRRRAALATAAVAIAVGYGGWPLLKAPRTTNDERVMAGGAAVSELDGRSRLAVPLRRPDRGDDRPSGRSGSLETWRHRADVGDALQGYDETS